MEIKKYAAYTALEAMFKQKGYSQGIKDNMPIYSWDNVHCIPENLTPGHYVYAFTHGNIKFKDIPEEYLTREFFLHTLSGSHREFVEMTEIVKYVKEHIEKFDKQFFKDHIATTYYAVENDFEYMPLEFIDEEMVACAMFATVDMCIETVGFPNWFYCVYRRTPEFLTKELYILAARCFAKQREGKYALSNITPERYKTMEFYLALCDQNPFRIMNDIPESVLTTNFLISLLKDSPENIQCFSERALEKEVQMPEIGTVKCWQAAVILDGYQISAIPLNDERVDFFLSIYDKDSDEYEYGFKDKYKKYLREKHSKVRINYLAGIKTPIELLSPETFLDTVKDAGANHKYFMLPIYSDIEVPKEYSKKYDKEEYLLEIYKKIGIHVLEEVDDYYYIVTMPNSISIFQYGNGFYVESNEKTLLHYYDRGSYSSKSVGVDHIGVTL